MSVQNVIAALNGHSGLTALVGTRIYRVTLPQKPTYPLILFRVTEEPENSLTAESGLSRSVYEFEIYADSYGACDSIKTQLHAALTASSAFSAIRTAIADDDYQDDTGKYSVFIDYSIW